MKSFRDFLALCLIFLIVFSAILVGCGTIRPNIPFAGKPYPTELDELAKRNTLLVQELGKLPEVQDGISLSEKAVLQRINRLYDKNPERFNEVFNDMYRIGKPNVRKYCSPLQALYWLAEDNELNSENNPLVNYSLKKLLDKAWKLDALSYPFMSDEQIKEVIDGIENESIKKQYLSDMKNGTYLQIQHNLLVDYKRSKRTGFQTFSKKSKTILEQTLISKKPPRWKDFKIVTDRLNAPQLIDYYERRLFKYHYEVGHGEDYIEVLYVFNYNKGHCAQITAFTKYVLQKAGYKANKLIIYHPAYASPKGNHHRVCKFEVNGRKYIMDNGRTQQFGIIPYDEYDIEINTYLYEAIWEELKEFGTNSVE